jgi:hypothetical protein
MGIPFSSRAFRTPICETPRGPPPLNTSPTFCAFNLEGANHKITRKQNRVFDMMDLFVFNRSINYWLLYIQPEKPFIIQASGKNT